jgi:proliferating cell nuclear antigen
MLEARLAQASLLKRIVEAMKDLCTEASFEFSERGLQVQAMDSSHVSLCYLTLQKEGFAHYGCGVDESLGVSLLNLSKVLKCAANEDSVTLKALDDGDVLTLMFESKAQDRSMDFDLKLMDLDQEQLCIPETVYHAKFTIDANEFKRIISDLQVLGDTCVISCSEGGVRFSVAGDVGTANIVLKPGQREVGEPVELRFALRYLNFFTKATPLSTTVELSLSKDAPLLVKYQIESCGSIQFFLAPKIEEGET